MTMKNALSLLPTLIPLSLMPMDVKCTDGGTTEMTT